MCDCLPKCCVSIVYIYIYHVNKFEARLLFLYLPLKVRCTPEKLLSLILEIN